MNETQQRNLLLFSPPNQLTLLRIVLTPVFLGFLFSESVGDKQISLGIFFIAMITDWYDGWVARRWGYVTRWGQFLDPLADKIIVLSTFLGFVHLGLLPALPVWIIVVRDVVITLLRIYFEHMGKQFSTSKFAKTKTFLQFVLLYYTLLGYIASITEPIRSLHSEVINALTNPSLMEGLCWSIALVTLFTGIAYLVSNRHVFKSEFNETL